MTRYIDAEEFLDLFYVAAFKQDKLFVKTVEMVVEDTPTADVVELKHGYWKTVPMFDEPDCDYLSFECSCCGNLDVCEENYCSDCGAKMDGERRDI